MAHDAARRVALREDDVILDWVFYECDGSELLVEAYGFSEQERPPGCTMRANIARIASKNASGECRSCGIQAKHASEK